MPYASHGIPYATTAEVGACFQLMKSRYTCRTCKTTLLMVFGHALQPLIEPLPATRALQGCQGETKL